MMLLIGSPGSLVKSRSFAPAAARNGMRMLVVSALARDRPTRAVGSHLVYQLICLLQKLSAKIVSLDELSAIPGIRKAVPQQVRECVAAVSDVAGSGSLELASAGLISATLCRARRAAVARGETWYPPTPC